MTINQSLAHGLDILLLYDTATPLLSVAEISKKLKYSQSKAYRLVRTLTKYSLLQEDKGTARYTLGLSALRLGLLAQCRFNIAAIARPFMRELSQITKETVFLTAVYGTKGIVLERVESEEPIRYSLFQPGAQISLHAGASGKILMAYLPEREWDEIIFKEGLKRYTSNTITDVDKLKSRLRRIRKKGYAFSDQEVDKDVRAIAGPILNGLDELLAGLVVGGPAFRISMKRVHELSKLVVQYARKISSELS
ncbi:MAG: IclR family transcriptional regulator [Thermodesulfobacteriota bacterium]